MREKGGGQSRNDQFLAALADELSETPLPELLGGSSVQDAQQLAERARLNSQEEAGRRWLLHFHPGHGAAAGRATTWLVSPRRSGSTGHPLEGATLCVKVIRANPFGALVRLGASYGFLNIARTPWSRSADPAVVLKTGDLLDLKILEMRLPQPPQLEWTHSWQDLPLDAVDLLIETARPAARLRETAGEALPPGPHTLLEHLVGTVVRGTVKSVNDYAAFVDLGGIEGLLHITDMAWRRVQHPSEVVKVGDEIAVRILKLDREHARVSLGLKQLRPDPWQDIARRYPPHTRVFGKVTNIADYGAFVEIEEGVEGLVHVSEMDWTNKNVKPAEVVHPGEHVEVQVLDVDEERRRIALSLKQCRPNPWQELARSCKRGDRLRGPITSITVYGLLIGLPGNIEGLVHLSDLSWDQPGVKAVRNYKKGQQIEVLVLSIDPERQRLSLSVKHLAKDPFLAYIAANPKGTIVRGVVKAANAYAAIIDLGKGIRGRLPASELGRARAVTTPLKAGETIVATITGADHTSRTIALSLKPNATHTPADQLQI